MQKPTFKNKSFTRKQAFTLIELLIVIAIIGILFIVLVSKVDFATDKAKATGVQTDFRSFQLAFDTVAKENAGFNTFGWDTGDANQNGKRDSYDEGDNGAGGGIAQNGIQDGDEVFTGHKVYNETFTKVYSLKKNGTGSYDRDALNRLETAINANLDPKLHITIKDDGEIVMANGAKDPWNKEYHGWYITNAEVDKKDRGAIVMYSDGANNEFGSEHSIANGIVKIIVPGSNKAGKDDYSIVSLYTYVNGYGEVKNITTGFSNNQTMLGGNGSNEGHIPVIPDTPDTPDVEEPEVVDAIMPGIYASTTFLKHKPTYSEMLYSWDELIANGIINENGSVVGVDQNTPPTAEQIAILTGDLVLPGKIKNIPDYAFYKCTGLSSICIQQGTETIGTRAFNSNSSTLKQVSIPASVIEIGEYAFPSGAFQRRLDITDINAWLKVTLPTESSNPMSSSGFLFVNDVEISHIEVPDTITSIGSYAFHGAQNLKTVSLPDRCTSIGAAAFASSTLEEINLPNSIVRLDARAFAYTRLTSIVLPNNDIEFGQGVFHQSTLTTVDLGNSITHISSMLFASTKISQIEIPSSVKQIEWEAFANCTNLETVIFNEGLETIGTHIFNKNTKIKELVIPASVKTIDSMAFEYCTALEKIVFLSENIEFSWRPLTYCESLKTIELHATTVPKLDHSFFGYVSTPAFEGIYVRSELIDAYKSHSAWKEYKDYIKALD